MEHILIVGGAGNVGRRIAENLGRKGIPVLVGGRRGGGASRADAYREVDVEQCGTWAAALDNVRVVIVCIDVPDSGFPAAVLGRGLTYIDITASDAVFRCIEALDTLARNAGGTAILSVGLAPGLTNLLAANAARDMTVARIEIGVLLGLGDQHGQAAIDWTLDRLGASDAGAIRNMTFGPDTSFPALPFDFADQHALVRRHGWSTVTCLAFDMPLMPRTLLRLAVWLARFPLGRRIMRWSSHTLRLGTARTCLSVEVTGDTAVGTQTRRLDLHAEGEAGVTALMAAEVAATAGVTGRPGVWHIEELFALSDFERALKGHRITIVEGVTAPEGQRQGGA